MKLKHLLLPVFSFIWFSIYAQNGKLAGKVTEENGDALISANVVIDASKGQAAVSDFDGNYEIKELPAGTYQVMFKYIGKDAETQSVTITAGQTTTLNVVMKEKQRMIDVVVVTSSKYEKKLSEETVSLDVLKSDVLNNQNVTDVSGGVQKIPGVTIADGQANIRGGSGWSYGAGSRVAVLYDDLLITTADADDAKWSMMPVENIDQIEVLKGAASAIYGSGALNGVINARMAYPTDEPYTKLQTYAGFYEGPTKTRSMKWWQGRPQWFAGFNFADRRKIGQWDLITGIAYNNDRGYLDSSDNQDFRINAKIRYRFKKVEGLSMGVNVLGYWSWGKTFFIWDSVGNKSYRPLVNTITEYENGRYLIDPFVNYYDKSGNKFSFRYRYLNSSNINSTGQGSIAQRNIIDFSYQRAFEVSPKVKFNFVAGVGAKIDGIAPPKDPNDPRTDSIKELQVDSFGYVPYPYLYGDKSHNAYNTSVYAQVDGKFFNKLNVSLGARWEYFNVDGRNSLKELTYPLFRLGLNYQAAEATYIRASFGQGFRYPSIAEFFVTTKLGAIEIFPNKNLKPETGYGAEIGLKQGFMFGKKSRTTGYFDVAGFWNQYQNMMEFMFGTFGDTKNGGLGAGFSSQNIGTTRILGVDAAFGVQTLVKDVEMNFLIGYTFINSRALNWDKPLILYNVVGDTIRPNMGGIIGGAVQYAYNSANAPAGFDTVNMLTYGMTSSSKTNTLKYRPTHQLKLLFNIVAKRFDFNLDYQFIGYQTNIDYAFVSPFFAQTVPLLFKINSFTGLKNYRDAQEARNYRGDNILNMAIGYKPVDPLKISFIIKNVANWEWMPRPGRFEAPRSYTVQLSYNFSTKRNKTNGSM